MKTGELGHGSSEPEKVDQIHPSEPRKREAEGPGRGGQGGEGPLAPLISEERELSFGEWKVVGELGRGGMGRVLLVERGRTAQTAALKILPSAEHGEAERRRFRHEQEILSRLEHPSIARFLDAGETPQGDLYLVMEKVDGVAIDRYCAQLPPSRRIGIFLDLCRAVAAAHQQLIVHCDLKPSNVLVKPDGAVKLLDFGLARLADERAATGGPRAGVWTSSYASPEQLQGGGLSAASDVYSLGVLLFEIVTGKKPFGEPGRALLTQLEGRRDPPRASSVLPAGSPRAGRRLLQDLDFVIARMLRPEPERRYASLDELIADLEACLDGRPIAARRGDRRYVLRRFVRRHGAALAAGLLVVLGLAGATLALALQSRSLAAERDLARRQEDAAYQASAFFLDLMVPPAAPDVAGPPTIRSLADRAAAQVEESLADARLVQARVLMVLGTHYRLVGMVGLSRRFFSRAQEIWLQDLGPKNREAVDALEALSVAAIETGNLEEGCRLAGEALALADELGQVEARITGLSALGSCAVVGRRYEDAERLLTEAEELSAEVHGFGSGAHEIHLTNLLRPKQALQRDADVERLLRQFLRERKSRRPWSSDLYLLARVHQLAGLLVARGALDEAEAELVTAMQDFEAGGGVAAPVFMTRWGVHPAEIGLQLAEIRRRRGFPADALELAVRAAERLGRDVPPDNPRHVQARRLIALALADSGAAEAEARLESSLIDLGFLQGDQSRVAAELNAALARSANRSAKLRQDG